MVNNPLYKNIQINHRLLDILEDKFIPSEIIDNIVHYNTDQHECQSYATDLNNSNFENNLNATIVSTGIEKVYINSSCIYNYINDQWQNPTL